MCGNLNQGNSEDEEDDLNEDRRVLCVNRRIGQCEMWFSDKGPMTLVARQNPLHDQMYDDLQTEEDSIIREGDRRSRLYSHRQ